MPIYVAGIAGRGLAAFDAADDVDAAEVRLKDEAFRRDLIVLQNQGRPLWDGVADRDAESFTGGGRAMAVRHAR